MKPYDRQNWIEKYLKSCSYDLSVDILNRDFVDDYVTATGASVRYQPYGANKSPQLARDLLAMKKAGILKRGRVSINGMGGMGFPTWVWSYRLRK